MRHFCWEFVTLASVTDRSSLGWNVGATFAVVLMLLREGDETLQKTTDDKRTIRQELRLQWRVILAMLALLWGIEIVDNVILSGALDAYGVKPRTLSGLSGVVLAPFLHGGFGHLIANTLPLVVFAWVIMLRETWHFFVVAAFTAVVSGLGIWLIGRDAIHIGASGMIFGLFGYLLLLGWYERSFVSIIVSLLVFFFYGGMIFGVLPTQGWISWEGHLCGFLAGVLAARLHAGSKVAIERRQRQAERA